MTEIETTYTTLTHIITQMALDIALHYKSHFRWHYTVLTCSIYQAIFTLNMRQHNLFTKLIKFEHVPFTM